MTSCTHQIQHNTRTYYAINKKIQSTKNGLNSVLRLKEKLEFRSQIEINRIRLVRKSGSDAKVKSYQKSSQLNPDQDPTDWENWIRIRTKYENLNLNSFGLDWIGIYI